MKIENYDKLQKSVADLKEFEFALSNAKSCKNKSGMELIIGGYDFGAKLSDYTKNKIKELLVIDFAGQAESERDKISKY